MKREQLETYTLAAIGLSKGIYKDFRGHEPATQAWAILGASVLAYEIFCPKGQTLSEGVDRALEKKRGATLGLIGITAAHLANILPAKVDPLHQLTCFAKCITRER